MMKRKSLVVSMNVLAVVLTALAGSKGDRLPPRVVKVPGFTVTGISVRTSNAKETSGHGLIPEQWNRFTREGLLAKIPNRVDSNILAIYTDYESDAHGLYTFILGAKVRSGDSLPPGMVLKTIPEGKYAVFTTDRGLVSKVVPQTWSEIWSLPKSAPGGDRKYGADFELYGQNVSDPQNAQVDIYVAIK